MSGVQFSEVALYSSDVVIKAYIEKTVTGGAGIARINGKTVFIEGSIPGETVLCRITREHRSWSQAELTEIIEVSPERVQPLCGHYGKCGGCNMQHFSYNAQLAAKTDILKDTFVRIGGFNPPEPLVFPSEPWEYRNRMRFHSLWGLKAKKSAEIIPISDCPIADPGIRKVLQGQNPIISPKNCTVYARDGLFLSENGITQGKTRLLNRELTLDARVFFQSNGAMLEKLITDLREIIGNTLDSAAGHTAAMADLYCGVGTFSAFLTDLCSHIDLVEENKTALALARRNLMSFPSASFYAQRSEDWAKTNLKSHFYSLIVVDPPRHGLDPSLARCLAKDGPPLLAYISCDPATLARDSVLLLKGGYVVRELRLYDFYPQCYHIETLAIFTR